MNVIVNGDSLEHPKFLLEFLVAWEKRSMCLTPMAYKWCSAISEVAGPGSPFRSQPQGVADEISISRFLLPEFTCNGAFSRVGPLCDSIREGDASRHTHEHPREPFTFRHEMQLFVILQVGFRLVMPSHDQPALLLDHTPHHNLVFELALSSHDDEVIADGVCAWIADSNNMPAGSCLHYLAVRVEEDKPFSPRLRRMCIRAIERTQYSELRVSELETIHLLNRLDVSVDDMEDEDKWVKLLVCMIHSPAGLECLSIHYWHLLEGFPLAQFSTLHPTRSVRLLEEAEAWEKLEVLMVLMWRFDGYGPRGPAGSEGLERLKRVTLKYLLRQLSALPKFRDLSELGELSPTLCVELKHICARARAEQSLSEPPPQ